MYFDSNGWVVSFFYKGTPPANLIISYNSSLLTNTTLSASIVTLLDTLGLNPQIYQIKYADVEHPNADSLLAFWKNSYGNVDLEIPSTYIVISQSASGGGSDPTALIDGGAIWIHRGTSFVSPALGIPHAITNVGGAYAYLILLGR